MQELNTVQEMDVVNKTEEKANPIYALSVMGGAAVFIIAAVIFFSPTTKEIYYGTLPLVTLGFALLLSAGIVLMQQELVFKIIGGVGMIVGGALMGFAQVALRVLGNVGMKNLSTSFFTIFANVSFMTNVSKFILIYAIAALAIGLLAFVLSMAIKKQSIGKLMLIASAAALILLVACMVATKEVLYGYILQLFRMTPFQIIGLFSYVILPHIINCFSILLFVYLIAKMSTSSAVMLKSGTGAKVWFGVCLGFTTLSTIVSLVIGSISALLMIFGIVGYILLLCGKRVGFELILLSVSISILGSISMGLTIMSPATAASALLSLINPLITWIVIRNQEKKTAENRTKETN